MPTLKKSINAGDRVEAVDIAGNMLLVATSKRGGNIWDASLRAFDLTTEKIIASVEQPCGCSDASWVGHGQRAVCAEDSGDVKVCGNPDRYSCRASDRIFVYLFLTFCR